MKGLQTLVIVLGVMIVVATTALVVLVVKKSDRGMAAGAQTTAGQGEKNQTEKNLQGNYITSYGVGGNLAVVLDHGNGKKTINLYDGKTLQFISTLVIGK